MPELSSELDTYLRKWHHTSTTRKANSGVTVNLPFEDFLGLFTKRQLASLQRAIDTGRLLGQQNRDNEFAFVLTWRSYSACSSRIFDRDTACIASRNKSKIINKPQAGDTLREGHRDSISKSLTGVAKAPDHCKAISEAKKGVSIKGWSEERKADRRRQIAEKKAAASRAGVK